MKVASNLAKKRTAKVIEHVLQLNYSVCTWSGCNILPWIIWSTADRHEIRENLLIDMVLRLMKWYICESLLSSKMIGILKYYKLSAYSPKSLQCSQIKSDWIFR